MGGDMHTNTMPFERFMWRGSPIPDIEAWARKRGDQMVHYRLTVRTVYGPEVSEGSMPTTFWNSLLIQPGHSYEELGRRNP